jgi:MULE transposase domain
MQLVIDSKHRVLMNNYPVTAVGFLDAGQQFNLVMLAVSNKEDEEFFCSLIQSLQNALASCSMAISVECAMSNNCSAIQHALRQYYPSSLTGNWKFHLLQNIKKKRSMWNINVPETIPASQKSKFIVRARDVCEKFLWCLFGGCSLSLSNTTLPYVLIYFLQNWKPKGTKQ